MSTMNDVVKLAVDNYRGKVKNFSTEESNEVLRKALIEANGGSEVLTYKSMRDGQHNGLFTIIEEILANTVVEGLTEDAFFNQMVDFRNVALGDTNLFLVENSTLFRVDEVAEGQQGIRRQRIEGVTEVPITTHLYATKIYEELNRILAGRVDFNMMIDRVAESFRQKLLNDIYSAWLNMTSDDFHGLVYYPSYPTAGTYSEDAMLDLIAHVEAAAGGVQSTIMGTKKALRKLYPSIAGETAKTDMYNSGYVGKFYGSDVVMLPQRHKLGSTDFVLSDNELIVVGSNANKPIKVVYEGDPLVIHGDPLAHGDLTQTYTYMDRYGVGVVAANNAGIGKYTFT